MICKLYLQIVVKNKIDMDVFESYFRNTVAWILRLAFNIVWETVVYISGKNNSVDYGPHCTMGCEVLPLIRTSWLFHLSKSTCYSSTKTSAIPDLKNKSKIQIPHIKSSTIFEAYCSCTAFYPLQHMARMKAMGTSLVILSAADALPTLRSMVPRQLLRD